MGYTTEFDGQLAVEPPLNHQEIQFLTDFSNSRRMDREKGPYYIGSGFYGQDREEDVRDYNRPPEGQPGLWCKWVPTEDGNSIEWSGAEKFYSSVEWMQYIIEHFVGENPLAKLTHPELSFLQGHKLNGEILAQGEDSQDRWTLIVRDNQVTTRDEEPLDNDEEDD